MGNNNNKEYVNMNGDKVLRVSDVLKVLNKEALLIWANNLGLKGVQYKHELERTARIGTMIHDIIDSLLAENRIAYYDWGKYKIFGKFNKEQCVNGIVSFTKWYSKNSKNFVPLYQEYTIVGQDYGGTIDVVLDSHLNNGHVIIADYKTSKDVYLTMILQLSAYVSLWEEINPHIPVDGISILLLDKKKGKKATTHFINRKDLDKYIELFEVLVEVAYAVSKLEKKMDKVIDNEIMDY